MKQAPDRKRLRREYLMLQAGTHLKVWASTAWIVWNVVFLLYCCLAILFCVGWAIVHHEIYWQLIITGLFLAIVSAGWLKPSIRTMRVARTTKRKLRYIPPVTPDTLPAEEVLVRAAGEPAAASEVLLRAAQRGQETPKEELLRVAEE